MKTKLLVTGLSIVLLSWPKTASAQCSTYGGRGTVVQANGLALTDTGALDSTGGVRDASRLSASLPGLLSGAVSHATAIGRGGASHSEASVAKLKLTVAGTTIGADFVKAHAHASCGSGSPTLSGKTEIDGLVINGLSIPVTGLPNQTVSLPLGGLLILNEQTSSVQGQTGSIVVNALHVSVPGVTNAIIASGFALGGKAATTFLARRPLVVINGPPTCTSISPTSGTAGTTVDVTLTGTNFDTSIDIAAQVSAGSAITVSNVVDQDGGTATATFDIPPDATGPVNVTATTTTTNGPFTCDNGVSFDISSPPPPAPTPCPDDVDGSGFIKPHNTNHNFGVAGGWYQGKPWGHMEFQDDDTGHQMHGTSVTDCREVDQESREIEGTVDVDGQSGDQCGPFTFKVRVAPNWPGDTNIDTFAIEVHNPCGAVIESDGEPPGSTTLAGGDIQYYP